MASACGFRLKRTNKSSKNQKKNPNQPHQMRVISTPEKSSEIFPQPQI